MGVLSFTRRGAALPHHQRQLIEVEIELHLSRATRLIARLDRADGDPDLEDDDPAGDTLDEHGEAPTEDGTEHLGVLPLYGLDQSLGPINEREAHRARARELYGCR